MMKIIAGFALAAIATVGLSATPASADEVVPSNEHVPTTCLYERWSNPSFCGDVEWQVSIAQECADVWADNPQLAATDPVCEPYKPKRRWAPKPKNSTRTPKVKAAPKAAPTLRVATPSRRPVAAPQASASCTVQVREGDTLWGFAVRTYGPQHAEMWKTIARVNQVDPLNLRIGSALMVCDFPRGL